MIVLMMILQLLWFLNFHTNQKVAEAAVVSSSATSSSSTTTSAYNPLEQVELRVSENIHTFLEGPVEACTLVATFRSLEGFPNNLLASDRDAALRFLYVQKQELNLAIFYGLEDGTFLAYSDLYVAYREPGQSGYDINSIIQSYNDSNITTTTTTGTTTAATGPMLSYNDCINEETGESEFCTIKKENAPYVQCIDDDNDDDDGNYNTYYGCHRISECPDEQSQRNCSDILNDNTGYYYSTKKEQQRHREYQECLQKIKWCPKYIINYSTTDDVLESRLGYIPLTRSCITENGEITQNLGIVVRKTSIDDRTGRRTVVEYGNCTYKNGNVVNRTEIGSYAYCSGIQKQQLQYPEIYDFDYNSNVTTTKTAVPNNNICFGTYLGGFKSANYDPRVRPWYRDAREYQTTIWSRPYPFFANQEIGITYGYPIYDVNDETNQRIFAGVLGVDLELATISSFLRQSYPPPINGADKHAPLVAIVEELDPNYIIGLSTGTPPARKSLKTDPSQPCTDDNADDDCTAALVSIHDLATISSNDFKDGQHYNRLDAILGRSYLALKDAGFPTSIETNNTSYYGNNTDNENILNHFGWVKVKESNDLTSTAYVASSLLYKYQQEEEEDRQKESFLQWRIIVVVPMEKSTNDTVTKSENLMLFILILLLGTVGFICCFGLTYTFYSYRNQRAMIHADWRFTCAFLLGCTIVELSSFFLLGDNTKITCLLRPWSLHLFIALAFSPLLVKVWRMYKLIVNSHNFGRKAITHLQAALYTLPIILIQFIILFIFTFIDPPIPIEVIETKDLLAIQHIICQRQTSYFLLFQTTFDALLVITGCILAYTTRNLDPKFGEAKQLIFAMYNIAFTAIIIGTLLIFVDMDTSSEIIFKTVGIFWGALISSCVFVVPRMLQVRKERRRSRRQRRLHRETHHNDTITNDTITEISNTLNVSPVVTNSTNQNGIHNSTDSNTSDVIEEDINNTKLNHTSVDNDNQFKQQQQQSEQQHLPEISNMSQKVEKAREHKRVLESKLQESKDRFS